MWDLGIRDLQADDRGGCGGGRGNGKIGVGKEIVDSREGWKAVKGKRRWLEGWRWRRGADSSVEGQRLAAQRLGSWDQRVV